MNPIIDKLAYALAKKARELVDGMKNRTGREPDVADYKAAFLPIIEEYNNPTMGSRKLDGR